jgi:heptose I phosphotransferase
MTEAPPNAGYCSPTPPNDRKRIISGDPIAWREKNGLRVTAGAEKISEALRLFEGSSLCTAGHGTFIKNIPGRRVIRMDADIDGIRRRFYLKCHCETPGLRQRVLGIFSRDPLRSAGLMEYDNICDFRKNGLPTVFPIACGQWTTASGQVGSLLMTEDFHPFVSLEDLLQNRPQSFTGKAGVVRKTLMLKAVAEYARKMHRAGFNHRDFNATHILLNFEKPDTGPEVALFDLQRVDRNRRLSWRWAVKSLAGLNYTLPHRLFSDTDRLVLVKCYRQIDRLTVFDRVLWLSIRLKTEKIRRHQEKKHRKRATGKFSGGGP